MKVVWEITVVLDGCISLCLRESRVSNKMPSIQSHIYSRVSEFLSRALLLGTGNHAHSPLAFLLGTWLALRKCYFDRLSLG